MGDQMRLRRHVDGTVVISFEPDAWMVVAPHFDGWVDDASVEGDGWTELYVSERPPHSATSPTGRWVG